MDDIFALRNALSQLTVSRRDPFYAKALSHIYKFDSPEKERELIEYGSDINIRLSDLERRAVAIKRELAKQNAGEQEIRLKRVFETDHDESTPRIWRATVSTRDGLPKISIPEVCRSSCEYFRGLGSDRFMQATVIHDKNKFVPAEREWENLARNGFWFGGRRYLPICGPTDKSKGPSRDSSRREDLVTVTVVLWFIAIEDESGPMLDVPSAKDAREWLMTFSNMKKYEKCANE
jgi:hypothetical protein